ncbi:MAG: adenylyl-sulfate kinase [Piscirickettsiaceae bacterium]|nr:MAG: adenylyl-sulfate kinase [Piscirickettsiaceae bacterium]PCH83261.1 MAG: adenylyl-sulfate kinase [Piscirickettsiaceae bacterium]PCH84459.1 MAG: adenylyl-sulfate kinase [Piscirickettsiaceae bacterium]
MSTNTVWHEHHVSQKQRSILKNQKPCILWFTGLSGSGKSTVANAVENLLFGMQKHTYLLDGDNVRQGLNKGLGFSEEDRIENIRRVGEVANLFCDAGLVVVTAFISPFAKDREMVRNMAMQGQFVEVFIDVPLSVCEQRDPKGLYKKARAGEIKDFTGIDSPYEVPANPELHIVNDGISIEEAAKQVLDYLKQHAYI